MNKQQFRHQMIAAIREEGTSAHIQRKLDVVRLKLRQHRQDLLEIIQRDVSNGVQGFDSETINRMRAGEVARARCAYGLPVRDAGVHKEP